MEPVPQDVRLVRRAFWLIRLRWVAVAGVVAAIFFVPKLFAVSLQTRQLYFIALLMLVYNLTALVFMRHFTCDHHEYPRPAVKKTVNFQMSADLVFLTLLLHFSGGIENPFVIYFIFHMIISSILLSPLESYLQATLASGLIFFMTLAEHNGIINHYCIEGYVPFCVNDKAFYVFGKAGVLSSTFYLVVFMASSIAVQARRQEEGYRLANIQLNEKDRVKDEYVARVTHDIKGHLAAIQSCLDLIETGTLGRLNEKQQEFVSRANDRTRKLASFVRSLLKLTRMRLAGKVETQTFDISSAVKKSLSEVSIKARDKSIILSNDSSHNPGRITASRLSVEELITNLLLNAIKYTPQGGSVSLSATDIGKYVQIDISDSGIGIPEDEIDYVFDEFFRASNARKTEKDGTGLGLALAKQIIERHGGRVSVKSKLNEGTTFTFTLARNPEQNS